MVHVPSGSGEVEGASYRVENGQQIDLPIRLTERISFFVGDQSKPNMLFGAVEINGTSISFTPVNGSPSGLDLSVELSHFGDLSVFFYVGRDAASFEMPERDLNKPIIARAVTVHHPSVSRRHMVVLLKISATSPVGTLVVTDMNSNNGTEFIIE